MGKRILILIGHPDPAPERYVRALATAYAEAAQKAGHEVRYFDLAEHAIAPLRSREDWMQPSTEPSVLAAQQAIEWAQHLLLLYPLWLGDVPAALKALLEQTLRPGFAFERSADGKVGKSRLKGRSVRIVVTMGMPGFFYRLVYRAHSLKSLRRNILAFCGLGPVRSSVIGLVEGSAARREHWLGQLAELGRRGD